MSAAARSASRPALLLGPVLVRLAACGSGTASPQPTATVTRPASSAPVVVSSSSAPPTGAGPGIVAVTTAGALVKLDPANGSIIATLVSGGVGDEVSVSPDGSTVYFAQRSGCKSEIESVSSSGGNPASIAPGDLPAISPDGI